MTATTITRRPDSLMETRHSGGYGTTGQHIRMNRKYALVMISVIFIALSISQVDGYQFPSRPNACTGCSDYYSVYTSSDVLVATINLTNSKFNGLLGYGNLTLCGEGEILKTSSGAWACGADLSTAGSSANYWQAVGGWMFPNTTSGGDYDVNVTTLRVEGSLQGANLGIKSGNISDTPWWYSTANVSGLEKCYIAGANVTTSPTLWWSTANVSGLEKCFISTANVSGLEKVYISQANISPFGYFNSISNISGLEKCYISNANVTTTPTMYWHQSNVTSLGAWKDFYYAAGNITGTVWTTCSNGTFRDASNTTVTISAGHISLESVTYDGEFGYDNLTKCSDGQVLKMSGSNWDCGTDNTGAASGSNYWQVIGGSMFPNTTSGGDVDVNVSTLKVDGAITGPNFAIKSGNISDTPWYYTTANISGLEKCYIAGANVTTSPTLYWHTANISGLEKAYISQANISPFGYFNSVSNVSGLEKCYIAGANVTTSPTLYWHTANISGLEKAYISQANISPFGYFNSVANVSGLEKCYISNANVTTTPTMYWSQANITGLGAWKDFYYAAGNITGTIWTTASNGTFVHKTGDSMTGALNITNQNITAQGVPNGLMGSNGTCTIIYGPTSRLEIC